MVPSLKKILRKTKKTLLDFTEFCNSCPVASQFVFLQTGDGMLAFGQEI